MAIEHDRPAILTDLVVELTSWGRSLVGRPGVTGASSLDEITTSVDRIRAQADKIDTALGEFRCGLMAGPRALLDYKNFFVAYGGSYLRKHALGQRPHL
jgi:hypothetical protein